MPSLFYLNGVKNEEGEGMGWWSVNGDEVTDNQATPPRLWSSLVAVQRTPSVTSKRKERMCKSFERGR